MLFTSPIPRGTSYFGNLAPAVTFPYHSNVGSPATRERKMPPPPPLPYHSAREHPRLRVATPVQVHAGERLFLCNTEDISVGGLGAKCPKPPAVATRLRLLFNLPNAASVSTDAIVRYVRADRFGVQFLDLLPEAHGALDDYTRRALGYTRNGHRIAKRLTVTLRSGATGAEEEVAETVVLSRHGGRLVCRAHFKVGDELALHWPGEHRDAPVRVVFRRLSGPSGLIELGFQFLDTQDFWQMESVS